MVRNRSFNRLPDARVGMGGGRRSRARLGETIGFCSQARQKKVFNLKSRFRMVIIYHDDECLRGDLCHCDEPRFDTRNINIPSRLRH